MQTEYKEKQTKPSNISWVIAVVVSFIAVTMVCNSLWPDKEITKPANDHEKQYIPPADKFKPNQKAVFLFTGDTVLIINKNYLSENSSDGISYFVLYKDKYTQIQKIEINEQQLKPVK